MIGKSEYGKGSAASRFSLALLLLALLCINASASLLVSVSPRQPGLDVLSLYPDEPGYYEVTVLNQGPGAVESVLVKASAAEGLKVLNEGLESSVVATRIDSISEGEKKTVVFKVKPKEFGNQPLFLYIDYGVDDYTHLAATYLNVLESPLQINAALSQTALDVGGEGSITLSFKNNGSTPVSNINADLIVFSGLESLDGTLDIVSLASGEGYGAKEFVFSADPEATGKRPLELQVSFDDALGRHVIEKSFYVEIQSRNAVLYLMVAIIILLVFVALVSRGKDSKSVRKLEKPLAEASAKAAGKQA